MRFTSLRDVATIGLCLGLGLVAGCESQGAKATTSQVSQAGAKAMAPPTGVKEPHETGKPVGDMSPDDWFDYLKGLSFDPSLTQTSKERWCGADTPDEHSTQCLLDITPVANVHKFKFKDTHTKGTVLAKIYNRGPEAENSMAIPAYHTVLWVVEGGESAYLDMDNEFKPTSVTSKLAFTLCVEHPNTTSMAGFYKCANSPGHLAGRGGQDTAKMLPPFTMHTSPPWVTCAEGCCNADGM